MPVPSVMTDLSTAAASNSPAGSETVGPNLDNYLRAIEAIVRREQAQGASVASAATVDLGAITDGSYVHITGTTTITSFGTVAAGIVRVLVFDGALTLTHNATSLILQSAANIITRAGDVAAFISEGSANWRCINYQRADGSTINKLINPAPLINGSAEYSSIAAPSLTTSPLYTAVEMVTGWASGGAVSAGTLSQDTAAPIGVKSKALKFAGVTLTGSGQLSFRYRMESLAALNYKNKNAILQIKVQHDVGSSINYTTVLRKPTAADNYTSTTVIATSSAVSVASGSGTTMIPFPNGQALGDVSNGLEIEIQVACGAVTTKNFWFTDWQLDFGSMALDYNAPDVNDNVRDCLRFYEEMPFQFGIGATGASQAIQQTISFYKKRANPTSSISGGAVTNGTGLAVTTLSSTSVYVQATSSAAGVVYPSGTLILNARL